MRVLLLNPPSARRSSVWPSGSAGRLYPLRLAYIASALQEAGSTVGFVDCPLEGYDQHASIGAVFAFHPDVVYAELGAAEPLEQLRFMTRIRDLGAVRIVLGGRHAAALAGTILPRFEAIEAIVCGEADRTLLDVVESWYQGIGAARVPGVVCRGGRRTAAEAERTPHADLDAIPFPDRETVPFRSYQSGWIHGRPFALVAGSRGCPRECAFCSRGGGEAAIRYRTPGNVALEIEELVRAYGVREIRFVDAAFNSDIAWALGVAEALVPWSLAWHCTAIAHCLSQEELRAYRRAGCRDVFLSPVCPSEEAAERLGTEDGPEAVRRVLEFAAREDVRVHVNIVAGEGELPTLEEAQGFAATLAGCDVAIRRVRPQLGSSLAPEIPDRLIGAEEATAGPQPLRFSLDHVRRLPHHLRGLFRRPPAAICVEAEPAGFN